MELPRIGIALLLALSVAFSDTIAAATSSKNSTTSSLSTEFEIAVILSDPISSLAASAFQQAPTDFVLVSNGVNASGSEGWLEDVPDSYDTAASSRILYQTARWVLLEDGAKHEALSSYWARFQAVNSMAVSSSRQSVCATVVEWEEASSTAVAVEVETRLSEACEANDTIALAFTSVIPDAIAEYLEGTRTLNSNLAPLALLNADDLMASPPPSSIPSRVFVLLNDELCSKNVSTTGTPQGPVELLVLNLSARSSCDEAEFSKASSTVPPSTGKGGTSGSNSSSNDSDWTHEWLLIVPICCGTFLLGSVFLVYVMRRNKLFPTSETPKDDKELTTNLAYVLAI
ncbi:hypothetical protein BBJ28_00015943 [Nothophytophthora sp. Chile5]|nr:hypothetical protein BBJ28_00015943 [Nothophytophthora sp. Chile5]